MSDTTWTPRVGEMIKRRNDPDAPGHKVTAVRGTGPSCTVVLDHMPNRWWTTDMFEPAHPIHRPPVRASPEARLNEALAEDSADPSIP
jgi:hypothetical protein